MDWDGCNSPSQDETGGPAHIVGVILYHFTCENSRLHVRGEQDRFLLSHLLQGVTAEDELAVTNGLLYCLQNTRHGGFCPQPG